VLAGVGVALLLLLAGYAHELGAEMAKRLFRNAYGVLAISASIGVLLVFSIPKGARPDIIAIVNAIVMTIVLCLLVRWPVRERWWGKLLVDLRRPRPVWVYALAAVAVFSAVMLFPGKGGVGRLPLRNLAGAGQVLALSAWMYALYARPEIRERGIVNNGQLIPWNRVEGHWWDDTRGKAFVLRLSLSGWRGLFCNSNPLIVPVHLKDEVDATIQRYLRDWPV
jgi:hypothetical protein